MHIQWDEIPCLKDHLEESKKTVTVQIYVALQKNRKCSTINIYCTLKSVFIDVFTVHNAVMMR